MRLYAGDIGTDIPLKIVNVFIVENLLDSSQIVMVNFVFLTLTRKAITSF